MKSQPQGPKGGQKERENGRHRLLKRSSAQGISQVCTQTRPVGFPHQGVTCHLGHFCEQCHGLVWYPDSLIARVSRQPPMAFHIFGQLGFTLFVGDVMLDFDQSFDNELPFLELPVQVSQLPVSVLAMQRGTRDMDRMGL